MSHYRVSDMSFSPSAGEQRQPNTLLNYLSWSQSAGHSGDLSNGKQGEAAVCSLFKASTLVEIVWLMQIRAPPQLKLEIVASHHGFVSFRRSH